MHRLALLFGFVGPLVGSVGWVFAVVWWFQLSGDGKGKALGELLLELFVLPWVIGLWGYVVALPVGFVPAAATGALYVLVLRRGYPEGNPSAWLRGLVGAQLGGVTTLLFGLPMMWLLNGSAHNLAVLLLPGAIAGCLCCLAVQGRLYRWALKTHGKEGV